MEKFKLFVIWLDGYMQACGSSLNEEQTTIIKNKVDVLFEHEANTLTKEPNKTLEELGQEHGFTVHQGFPNQSNGLGRDENGVLYRC